MSLIVNSLIIIIMFRNNPELLTAKERLKFLFKDSLIYGSATAINKSFSLITFPLLTRYFSVEEFGIIDFFSIFSVLLSTLIIFGQDSAVARFFYDYSSFNERKSVTSQSFSFQVAIVALLVPVLFYFSNSIFSVISIGNSSSSIIKIVILQIPFLVLINFSQNILKWSFSRVKFLIISIGSVFTTLLLLILGITIIKMPIEGYFWILLLVQALFAALGIYFVKQWIGIPKKIDLLKPMTKYAIPFGIIAVIGAFVPSFERSIVNKTLGIHEMGLYAAGAKISFLILIFVQAFQTAWGPFSLAIHKQTDAALTYNLVLRMFTIIVLTMVLMLTGLSKLILGFFATSEYLGAHVVVFPLSFALAVQSIGWITEIGIGISKKSQFHIISYGAFVCMTILGIMLFAKMFGIYGVALGVLVGHFSKAIVASWLAQKLYPLSWDHSRVSMVVLVALTYGICGFLLPHQIQLIYYFAGSLLIALLGASFLISRNERILIRNFILKFTKN